MDECTCVLYTRDGKDRSRRLGESIKCIPADNAAADPAARPVFSAAIMSSLVEKCQISKRGERKVVMATARSCKHVYLKKVRVSAESLGTDCCN